MNPKQQQQETPLLISLYILLTYFHSTSTTSYVLKSGDQSDKYITAIPEQIVLAAKALTIFFDPKYLLKIVLKKFFFPPQAKRFLPKS